MPPTKNRRLALIASIVVLILLIIGVLVIVAVSRQGSAGPSASAPAASASAPTQSNPATGPTPQPAPSAIVTKYFVNTEAEGVVYATGVKIKGTQVSGWAGALRSSDVACFNGTVADGRLSGTLWSPADEGGGPMVSQRFSWRVSGSGDQLKLVEVVSITPLTEVNVQTVNRDAALPAANDWQSTFDRCAKLTGGLK